MSTDPSRKRILEYYRSKAERERTRLIDPDRCRLEFEVNLHFLERYLEPRSRILDIGGGPGRYAIEMAKQGHRVVLADISPDLLVPIDF